MGDSRLPPETQQHVTPVSASAAGEAELFASPPPDPSNRGKFIGVAAAILVLAIALVLVFQRDAKAGHSVTQNVPLPPDAYSSSLIFTQLAMSESTSLSGGKSTFIDGHVRNGGSATLTGVTMQVLFRNDVSLSPQVEVLPLTLIRTHEPYVDTEPVSASPLKPGDDAEFRLIFETVNANWNQQMPELQVVAVDKR